jgi:TfoX/Sxy family transcriptional regulator of competence genes
MNDGPHLLAIIESKMAQVRTQLEHNGTVKAQELLTEVEIYTEDLRYSLKN